MIRWWRWMAHIRYLHYVSDLGVVTGIQEFWWGTVAIRECAYCRRRFVDFEVGLPETEEETIDARIQRPER
jgi:hypothetical protein